MPTKKKSLQNEYKYNLALVCCESSRTKHLKRKINLHDINILIASTIQQLLRIVLKEKIDIIVIDYQLNKNSITNFLKRREKHPSLTYTPILIVTDSSDSKIDIDKKYIHFLKTIPFTSPYYNDYIKRALEQSSKINTNLGFGGEDVFSFKLMISCSTLSTQEYLCEQLQTYPQINVITCNDPWHITFEAKKEKPDVILLELTQNHRANWSAADAIRFDKKLQNIVVIGISRIRKDNLKLKAFSYGLQEIIYNYNNTNMLVHRLMVNARLSHILQSSTKNLSLSKNHYFSPLRVSIVYADEPFIQKISYALLGEPNIIVNYTCYYSNIINVVSSFAPDILLLDNRAPNIGKYRVIELLRRKKLLKDIPIVKLAPSSSNAYFNNLFENDYQDCICADFSINEIKDRIFYHAKSHQNKQWLKILLQNQEKLETTNNYMHDTYKKYLPEPVFESISKKTHNSKETKAKTVTILMSDLRGFSLLSQSISTKKLTQILNIYLDEMTRIVHKYNGIIDEIIGDALLVLFGLPKMQKNQNDTAVACALEMQNAMLIINSRLTEQNFPTIEMGIGIHTGRVYVGDIGNYLRLKYAVVGTTVNTTARIESYTFGGQVLISEKVLKKLVSKNTAKPTITVTPQGETKAMQLYEVTSIIGEYDVKLDESFTTSYNQTRNFMAQLHIIENKIVPNNFEMVQIIELSKKEIRISSDKNLSLLTPILLKNFQHQQTIYPYEIYGKVSEYSCGIITIRFSKIPEKLKTLLLELNF